MSNSSSPYGYALRRSGSCDGGEVDCGGTWGNKRACCPGSTKCPRSSDTSICCPSSEDCTDSLLSNPHCGDDTADLYYVPSSRGYFCCSNSTTGFILSGSGYVGCAENLADVGVSLKTAKLVSEATSSTTSTSSAATSSTVTTTTDSDSQTTAVATTASSLSASGTSTDAASSSATDASTTDGSSHSNTGAIAGGVVGGVAGAAILLALLWFFLRRYKKNVIDEYRETQSNEPSPAMVQEFPGNSPTYNTPAHNNAREVGRLQELSASSEPYGSEISSSNHG